MARHASPEETAGAQAYERLHVPALFGPWAPVVADTARIAGGDRVLDVACGTGVLAREALRRVGQGGTVTGVDPNAGMLAVAAQIEPGVRWVEGTAESLPVADGAVDVVVSQFGLMFFADRAKAAREMLRALVPGGRLAVAVWDTLENSEPYATEVGVLQEFGGQAAADALRAPFVLGDASALRAIFEAAGATHVECSTHRCRAVFPSVRVQVEADLRGWLPVMGVHLEEGVIERILAAAEQALAPWVTRDGSVSFESCGHIVSARART